MKKIYYSCLSATLLSLLTSCADFVQLMPVSAFMAAPDSDLSTNFRNECSNYFDSSKKFNPESEKCHVFSACLTEKMFDTVLADENSWPTVKKIKPRYGSLTPVSEMRTNAEKAGPKAVEMFQLIYDIRKQCIIETGLDKIMVDT